MSVFHRDGDLDYCEFDVACEKTISAVSDLISKHLSEPYSIFVYWYFLNTWPQYSYTVKLNGNIVGVIISKVEPHRDVRMRGYIGMLVIDPACRKRGIATNLIKITINNMKEWDNADEIMLETEVINKGALNLYESMGFMRTKRLYRYYMNTHDAYRLILPLTEKSCTRIAFLPPLEV